ncbi:MAG: HAD family hydrolase [Ruminococcus sp.]|nr:HAD family hydrolase [Ruminococcus sp.]
MIDLAIFDLDGTLADSIYDLADAVNKALAEGGFPTHDYDEYRHFVGNGAKKLIERALPEGSPPELRDRIHAAFSANYRACCLDKTKPYDGIPELIGRLREQGVLCAVASNKPDEFSALIVESLFGKGVFSLIRGKRDGTPTKPAPDIVYSIAEELDCDLGNAVYIGDSDVDVQTAHNAGLKCIGCAWGFRGEEELLQAGADFIARQPSEIGDIIGTVGCGILR